jgi:acyl carrier protein
MLDQEYGAVLSRLKGVFEQIFRQSKVAFREDLTAASVPGWDSLTHVKFILAVERAFGVRFTMSEIGSFENLGQLARAVHRKTGAARV